VRTTSKGEKETLTKQKHSLSNPIARLTLAYDALPHSSDESKFLNDRTSQEMIEFLTRVPLVGLSKNAQLQLSAFIEGFAKVRLMSTALLQTATYAMWLLIFRFIWAIDRQAAWDD